MTKSIGSPVATFRRSRPLWGYLEGNRLFDRYARQAGWVQPGPGRTLDVLDLSGRFLGELFDRHYVRRHALREEPIHRAPRVQTSHPASPSPVPAQDSRTPLDNGIDALPWPLSPPEPPAR